MKKSEIKQMIKEERFNLKLKKMVQEVMTEMEFADGLAFKKYKLQHRVRPDTEVIIGGKKYKSGDLGGDDAADDVDFTAGTGWSTTNSNDRHDYKDLSSKGKKLVAQGSAERSLKIWDTDETMQFIDHLESEGFNVDIDTMKDLAATIEDAKNSGDKKLAKGAREDLIDLIKQGDGPK